MCCVLQVWFKNRRAKCRQQQKAQDGKNPASRPKKSKSPTPGDVSPVNNNTSSDSSYKTAAPVTSTPTPTVNGMGSAGSGGGSGGSQTNSPSIWSPASISPHSGGGMADLVNSGSCMQRSYHHHSAMHGGHGGAAQPPPHHSAYQHQNSLNYAPTAAGYYSNMDYLSQMQLPVMTSNQMSPSLSSHSQMTSQSMGSYGTLPPGNGLHRSTNPATDCLADYKDNGSWPKFQVL